MSQELKTKLGLHRLGRERNSTPRRPLRSVQEELSLPLLHCHEPRRLGRKRAPQRGARATFQQKSGLTDFRLANRWRCMHHACRTLLASFTTCMGKRSTATAAVLTLASISVNTDTMLPAPVRLGPANTPTALLVPSWFFRMRLPLMLMVREQRALLIFAVRQG